LPLHDDAIIVADGYRVSSENNIAPGIARLAHGQQGLSGKSRDNMTMVSSSWESRDIKISFMCGMQDHAGWGVDGNRGRCWALVADGGGVGEEMGSTTGIGDGVKW